MENPQLQVIPGAEEFRINAAALRESIEFVRKNDPRFKDATLATMAEAAGIAESTFKKLLAGGIADPRTSTMKYICHTFGLDPRVPMGLAPTRDFVKEQEAYDPTLMGEMRRQLDAMQQSVNDKESELNRLRKIVLEKGEALGHAEEKVFALKETIEDRNRTIQHLENMYGDHKNIGTRCKAVIAIETIGIIVALALVVLI